jgi:hypothetical protein
MISRTTAPRPELDAERAHGHMGALGEFLRARREHASPTALGVSAGSARRRARGLRREEVAVLAGLSVTWYTRIEQGQDVHPSHEALGAIARALRFGPGDRAHLFRLARLGEHAAAGPGGDASGRVTRACDLRPSPNCPDGTPDALRRLLDALGATPAFLIDRYWDVLGRNAALEALMPGLGDVRRGPDQPPRNVALHVLTSEAARAGTPGWEHLARVVTDGLRSTLTEVWAADPGDHRAAALVATLRERSPHFRAWWPEHRVWSADCPVRRACVHPERGPVTFDITVFDVRSAPGLRLVAYVPADDATAAQMR